MLTLIRGLPGAGKSTLAKQINAQHVEADMFFLKDGKYIYNPKFIKDAHEWCKAMTKFHLLKEDDVVVSNTFVKKHEIEPYLLIANKFDTKIKIIEATGNYESVHCVPKEKIIIMKNNWEII